MMKPKKTMKYIKYIAAFGIIVVGYLIADSLLFNGIKPQHINMSGFQAAYFVAEGTEKKAAVVLLGGSHWGDYWGVELAKGGFVGLSLPYAGKEGLAKLPEEIELEYFEKAFKWLKEQPEVDGDKIVVMGASRNAELALVLAAVYPNDVTGAIAYAPSSVSWSNTVLPFNSDDLKASWTLKGKDIPFVPMGKIKGNDSAQIETLDYWKAGLQKNDSLQSGTIPVENINGPILLFSGLDDQVWPAAFMADQIEKRLLENEYKFEFQNINYPNAGHLISGNPNTIDEERTGIMRIKGVDHSYAFGGTKEGDQKAKLDAKERVFEFVGGM